MTNKPTVIFLMGPTASGKTDLAVGLREHLPVELVSVDSTLVYRGLDIGTAKPSADELAAAPHRLIDIRDPADPYSAADFRADAEREVADIVAQGRIPLLVGGTMLYFKALLEGMAEMPPAVPAVREQIEQEAQVHGWPHIHAQLAAVDPETATQIHPNHSQRLSRALEVYRASGQTMTELRRRQREQSGPAFAERYNAVQIAIAPRDRELLHERILRRFHKMLEQGLLEEVQRLRDRGDLHTGLPAIRAVGYRQVWEYLECRESGRGSLEAISREQMIERGVAATRQLAKRQLTWLRGWPDLEWVYTQSNTGKTRSFEEILYNGLNFIGSRAI